MDLKNLKELNDQELIQMQRKTKQTAMIDAALVGITIGIFIYSAINNGFGFSMLFPVVIGYIVIRSSKKNKALGHEIERELSHRAE